MGGRAVYRSELLTPKEAADLLRVSLETVRRLLRARELPGCKVGRRQWRVRRVDLDAYLRRDRAEDGGAGVGE